MALVLVVEDDQDLGTLLCAKLSSAGFETKHVPDATLAINQAYRLKPDVIILDLGLPGGGGLFVLENLTKSVHTNHIPIIVTTGLKDTPLQEKVLTLGVKAYVEKPYDLQQLVETVRGFLRLDRENMPGQ